MVQASTWLLMQKAFFQLQFIFSCITTISSNFDTKSFKYSHKEHFAKTEPLFLTSTLRWCLFLKPTHCKLQNTSNVWFVADLQKCNLKKWSNYKMHHNFRCWELNSKKYIILTCSSNFYTFSLTWSFHSQRLLHVLSNNCRTSCLPFSIPFNWCDIVPTLKSIAD
jgi:hypothetical protein